jgi:hypothetical protein
MTAVIGVDFKLVRDSELQHLKDLGTIYSEFSGPERQAMEVP